MSYLPSRATISRASKLRGGTRGTHQWVHPESQYLRKSAHAGRRWRGTIGTGPGSTAHGDVQICRYREGLHR